MTLYILLATGIVFCLALWFARKAGRDSAVAKAATKGLDNVAKANAAASDPDALKRVHERFRRH